MYIFQESIGSMESTQEKVIGKRAIFRDVLKKVLSIEYI